MIEIHSRVRRVIICLLLAWIILLQVEKIPMLYSIGEEYYFCIAIQMICLIGYSYVTLVNCKVSVKEFLIGINILFVFSLLKSTNFVFRLIYEFENDHEYYLIARLVIIVMILMVFEILKKDDRPENIKILLCQLFSSKIITVILLFLLVGTFNSIGFKTYKDVTEKKVIDVQTCIRDFDYSGPLGYTSLDIRLNSYGPLEPITYVCDKLVASYNDNPFEVTTYGLSYDYVNPDEVIVLRAVLNLNQLKKTNWEFNPSALYYVVRRQPEGISDFTDEVIPLVDEYMLNLKKNADEYHNQINSTLEDVILFQSNKGVKNVYMIFMFYSRKGMLIQVLTNPYIENEKLESQHFTHEFNYEPTIDNLLQSNEATNIKSLKGYQIYKEFISNE